MSLADKRGLSNPLEALKLVLAGQLPAKVATWNASHSAELRTWLAGSYAFGTSKTLDLYLDNSSEVTQVTLTGTCTAAQTVTALNAALPVTHTSSSVMSNYVQITKVSKGTASSIRLGSGTANSIFGWLDKMTVNFMPLRSPTWYGIGYDNLEGLVPSYPACILRGIDVDLDDNLQLVSYTILARLREVCATPDMGDTLYTNLITLAELMVDVLHDSANVGLLGQVNLVKIDNIKPSTSIEIESAGLIGAHVDLSIRVVVQEE